MASNGDRIRGFYASGKEDSRATLSRSSAEEFYYTEKYLRRLIKPGFRVLELGCATGYYAAKLARLCREYAGIDLSPENIAIFEEKIASQGLKNVTARVGDATRLDLEGESFDAVFCLGPLYHLPREERELVLAHDDVNPDLFFYTSPEEIEADASRHGLEPTANNGLDFFFAAEAIDALDGARLPQMRDLLDRMSASRSCVGLANHALLSVRKVR